MPAGRLMPVSVLVPVRPAFIAGAFPAGVLTAVVALRQLVEVLEELQVDRARQQGWSWRDIAFRLGVTKQAVHYKHGLRVRRSRREP
jgi:hypothetical protein